jgi:dihydrofolate reductase
MGKLIESTFVTLDGVISSPERCGVPYWDDEHTGYASKLLFAADALLLGRATYEGFASAWPSRSNDDPYTARINGMPKYVASTTLKHATWNATVLEGDVAAEVARLKDEDTRLLKFGTGVLDRTLLAHGLVDELHLWTFPVVAGRGERLLDGLNATHFDLVDSVRFRSGIVVHVCTPKA